MTKEKAEERSTPFLVTATEGSTARTTDPRPELVGPIWVCGRLKLKHVIKGALSLRLSRELK